MTEASQEFTVAMGDTEGAETETEPPFYTVAIYDVNRYCGGSEEGGWWYSAGTRVDEPLAGIPGSLLCTVFRTTDLDGAISFAAHLQRLLDTTANVGRRPISSVLSDGWYYAEVRDGFPPRHYPRETPHYE